MSEVTPFHGKQGRDAASPVPRDLREGRDAAPPAPRALGPMPMGRPMEVLDERIVRAPVRDVFDLVKRVEEWPSHLAHYRFVRMRERTTDGGGIVEMSANRPFGPLNWPTWWLSEMMVDDESPAVRFKHIGGITKAMDVEWSFEAVAEGTHVRLLHVWDGPRWPLIGIFAATTVIGPLFVHGIAFRTLEGLGRVAERQGRGSGGLRPPGPRGGRLCRQGRGARAEGKMIISLGLCVAPCWLSEIGGIVIRRFIVPESIRHRCPSALGPRPSALR